jgi:hypothetical protein
MGLWMSLVFIEKSSALDLDVWASHGKHSAFQLVVALV